MVPSTRMNISLPQQGVDEAAEDGNDEVNRSVYVTPSAEDVKSPTPSVQSLTYDRYDWHPFYDIFLMCGRTVALLPQRDWRARVQ